MPNNKPIMYSIRESPRLTREQWDRFAELVIAEHGSLGNGLAAVINGYTAQRTNRETAPANTTAQ